VYEPLFGFTLPTPLPPTPSSPPSSQVEADMYVSAMPVDVFKRLCPAPWAALPFFAQLKELEGVPVSRFTRRGPSLRLHTGFTRGAVSGEEGIWFRRGRASIVSMRERALFVEGGGKGKRMLFLERGRLRSMSNRSQSEMLALCFTATTRPPRSITQTSSKLSSTPPPHPLCPYLRQSTIPAPDTRPSPKLDSQLRPGSPSPLFFRVIPPTPNRHPHPCAR
jgi:hypothetical protein